MMKDYYQQSMRALQLAGMSKPTQKCYTRSVRMLADFYNKTPDQITETQLQDYFLHRRNTDKWSAATLRICYSGIKFFFINVLQRDWHALELIHAKHEQRLPTVLSLDEVRAILAAVSTPQNKAYLTVLYSCDLRLHETLYLQVSDIDGDRMRIHVHRGKGAKDRYCPASRSCPQYLKILLEAAPQPRLDLPASWTQRQRRPQRSTPHSQRIRAGRSAPGFETA